MKVMLTLYVFEGGDPATGERRTMTIGGTPAELPQRAAEWAHDVVAWMLRDDIPEPAKVDLSDVPMDLWDTLETPA